MALPNPTYRFRGIDAPNVAGSTNLILNALGTPGRVARGIQEREKAQREEERANQLLQLKLNQDARAQERADREADLYKQREALGNILTNLPSTQKTIIQNIPSIEGNRNIIEARKKANEKIEERNRKVLEDQIGASEEYSRLLDEYRSQSLPLSEPTMKTTAPDDSTLLRRTTVNQRGVEDPRGRYVGYIDSSGKEVSEVERLFGNYSVVPSELPEKEKSLYYNEPERSRVFTDKQAHNKAMKESGLLGLKNLIPKTKIPELIPDTPSKIKEITEKKSKGEWIDEAYQSILDNTEANDNTKLLAIDKLQNQANLLFGKDPKPLTPTEKLNAAKELRKKEKEKKTLSDYYSLGVPKRIKTVEVAEKYLENREKKKDKTLYGAGALTLKAYETGVGTIDKSHQEDIQDTAKKYKITDKELASVVETLADKSYGFRRSSTIAEEIIDYIKANYRLR
jgi:hypothetical protein